MIRSVMIRLGLKAVSSVSNHALISDYLTLYTSGFQMVGMVFLFFRKRSAIQPPFSLLCLNYLPLWSDFKSSITHQ